MRLPRALRIALLAAPVGAAAAERLVALKAGGHLALSTRGPSALRVRFSPDDHQPFETPMVAPDEPDADYEAVDGADGAGIKFAGGSVLVSATGALVLRDAAGGVLTTSEPLAPGLRGLVLSTKGAKLYGRGASPDDARQLTTDKEVDPLVCNRATYAPYYYSTDGYSALGVVNITEEQHFPANYSKDGTRLSWRFAGAFEVYFMPAGSLAEGTRAYYALIGAPAVLPRFAFGFTASRWGWTDRAYIEDTISKFRSGNFPIDAVIIDFEWFTNESDYAFDPQGKSYYHDFGFNAATFNEPQQQLATYKQDSNIRMGGIRKPRLGNTELLDMARSKGWILPNGEPGGAWPPDLAGSYALQRNLDFTQPAVRQWYAENLAHFYDDGVSFWWNDEGETGYYQFHWWNVAQAEALRSKDPDKRFYSLNRAWSPGMARLGAAVWTGDISATWDDLLSTPGMMLNWILGGAPYVACDIGGFNGEVTGPLLTRWMQVGAFMPLMRVHSVLWAKAHFPWNFGDAAANNIRRALEIRYRLVPYHYSLAHAMFRSRAPWMRPLAMDYPEDERAAGIATQWLDGGILVAPVLREDSLRQIYLPEGTWYSLGVAPDFSAAVVVKGPSEWAGTARDDEIPAFVRAGTILPLAPVVQFTDALPGGALEVQVYAGADASFDLVEDDGETMGYQTGKLRTTHLSWDNAAQTLSWKVTGPASGPRAFVQLFMTLVDSTGIYHSDTKTLGAGGSIHLLAQETVI